MNVVVVVPIFNELSRRLNELASSLAKQSVKPDKVIWVDPGSINREEVQGIANQFGFFYLEEDEPGSYAARNLAITSMLNLDNVIFAFTDSDCVVCGDWIRNIRMVYDSGYSGMLAGPIEIYNDDVEDMAYLYESLTAFRQKENVDKGHSVTANLCIPSSVFDVLGLFDSSLKSGGDYKFTNYAVKSGVELKYDERILVKHPARNTEDIYRKAKRVEASIASFSNLDYSLFRKLISMIWLPFKLVKRSKLDSNFITLALFVFALRLQLYKVGVFFKYFISRSSDVPRS